MSMIILDLDGCISDDRWRQDRILESEEDNFLKYHAYHSLLAWDEPMNADLFRDTRHDVLIFTVRPNLYYHATKEWLRRKGVPHVGIMMRDVEDYRTPVVVKEYFLDKLLENYEKMTGHKGPSIERAYDDQADIVDMYRRRGIKAKVRGHKK